MRFNKYQFLMLLAVGFLLMVSSSYIFAAELDGWVNFDKGMEKAAKEDKAVLVDFYTDWCHWCKVMDEKTFSDTQVAKKLKERFVAIKLNAEKADQSVTYQNKQYTNAELTRSFGVTGYPALAFLDSNGDPITIIPGFVPADQFINILEYIDQKCYKQDVSFEDFLKNGGCKDKKS
jgi:thioredoxin-related protein